MNNKHSHSAFKTIISLLILATGLLPGGCATMLYQPAPQHYASPQQFSSPQQFAAVRQAPVSEPAIVVHTRSNDKLTFHDGWMLTFDGVAGTVEYENERHETIVTDTTVSYNDVVNAAPARSSSTMRQFLLTILGVILLIGLAAIMLYAAFIATGR